METGKRLFENSAGVICEIPIKFVSLNEFLNMAKTSPFIVSNYKKNIEADIGKCIRQLPSFDKVSIIFLWIEENKRRDPDNIAFARKFILDALVRNKKIKNDTQRYIRGLFDVFVNGEQTKVILKIIEEEE